MRLLTKQIINGVLTSDILEVLKKICSNQEWNSIKNLEVETAVFYKQSDKANSIQEWTDTVLNEPGKLHYDMDIQSLNDKRSRKWFGFAISKFISPLLSHRKKLKAEMKSAINQLIKSQLNSEQTSVKLLINTLYGVIASKLFHIGNTVVGNNITARARVHVWLVGKRIKL